MTLATITVWRDAKEDPPTGHDAPAYQMKWTDRGPAYYHIVLGFGCWFSPDRTVTFDPQPSLWCDPQPPTRDGLTVADLRWSAEHALKVAAEADAYAGGHHYASVLRGRAARLRAALPDERPRPPRPSVQDGDE